MSEIKGEILVYKRNSDPDRPVLSQRSLKHPILAALFGWICSFIMSEESIDHQPIVLTFNAITRDKPNEIAGEVNAGLWEEYVRVYNNFRTLEKEVNLDIQTNERLKGKVIAHDRIKGNIYQKLEDIKTP